MDARSDVFALGAVFYEMLSGERPFVGNSRAEIAAAILERQPTSIGKLGRGVPRPLAEIIGRCLEKQPAARFVSAVDVSSALEAAFDKPRAASPRATAAIVVASLAVASIGAWQWKRASLERAARETIPRIERLVEERDVGQAFHLAQEARRILPDDPRLRALEENVSLPFAVRTRPTGARVRYKIYTDPGAPWRELGTSPIVEARVPFMNLRWRIEADGFRTWEGAQAGYQTSLQVDLVPDSGSPPLMVRIPEGQVDLAGETVAVPSFWLDQYEVTNRDYAAFVAAGGYTDAGHWRAASQSAGVSFEEPMQHLTDRAGRPGPEDWRLGSYPEGRDDHPVTGVSWFEAAAYCEFAGKSLPTLYHWRLAGEIIADDMLVLSNFSAEGTAPVGSFMGIGPYGAYDMAGNVKEWTWNAMGVERHVAGGAWNEPEYLFHAEDHLPPLERSDSVGFRCARLDAPPASDLLQPVEVTYYDFAEERPVNDEVYAALSSSYSYDRVPLDARSERIDRDDPRWLVETVSFEMGTGEPRMLARLYLPRNVSPPYQTVVYFPGSSALSLTSSENLAEAAFFNFLPAAGRAFVHPIYAGMYERGGGTKRVTGVAGRRDRVITWTNEVSRVVDYLEERDDVNADRLALFGLSLGAIYGPIFAAIEPRFQAAVFLGGGMSLWLLRDAQINPVNFAPRISMPTLVIVGRNDVLRPPETAQRPLFDLIDVAEEDKRFVVLEGGHIPDWNEIIRETLDWLDRYLGPVSQPAG